MEPSTPKRTFAEMTRREKTIFVLKVVACVLSFGFIYPSLMNE